MIYNSLAILEYGYPLILAHMHAEDNINYETYVPLGSSLLRDVMQGKRLVVIDIGLQLEWIKYKTRRTICGCTICR